LKTTLIFTENNNFAVAIFNSTQTQDPKILLSKFKTAITNWIKLSPEGCASYGAWEDSEESFNIGDYANYVDDALLTQLLQEEGISVEVTIINQRESIIPYNTLLVLEEEL